MPTFRKTTLARVRRNVSAMLTERCSIEREVYMKGTIGEPVHVFQSVAEDVPCRVLKAGSRYASMYQEVGSQEALTDLHRVALLRGTDFRVDDRIVVGERVYLVVGVEDALTDDAFVDAVVTRVRV